MEVCPLKWVDIEQNLQTNFARTVKITFLESGADENTESLNINGFHDKPSDKIPFTHETLYLLHVDTTDMSCKLKFGNKTKAPKHEFDDKDEPTSVILTDIEFPGPLKLSRTKHEGNTRQETWVHGCRVVDTSRVAYVSGTG